MASTDYEVLMQGAPGALKEIVEVLATGGVAAEIVKPPAGSGGG